MKFITSFLIGLCLFVAYVSLVFAAAGDPVTPLPFIQGNHVLYEDINYGTTKRVIHLDRVYSEFENGWGSPTVSRFTVTAAPTFGALYNTVDGISVTTLLNVEDVVTHPQGIVIYVPPTTTVDASTEIRFILSTTDNSRAPENCILVVNLFSQCPNVPDLSGNFNGNIVAPPIPQADISWDAQNTKFKFAVNGAYLRDMAVYLIDYSSFNPITDSLRATTNCANRPAVPAFTRFDQIWDSAPHALFQDALTGYYAAYAHTAKWVPSTTSCSQVSYSASFGFTEFVHCNVRGSNTNSIQVTTSSVNNTITYAGSLQVNVLQPIDPLVETLGYSEFNHFFPFRFTFRSRVHAVVGVTSEKQLRVYVRISELDDQGNLHLVLETHYPGTGLTDPTVQSPLYYVSVNPSSCPAGTVNCIQSWTYSKNLWTNDDNGPYFFDWAVIADPAHRVSVTVTLKHEVNQVREFDNLEIGKLLLRLFNNALDMENGQNSKGLTYAFRATERVWVRGDLGVPEEDQANFLVSYVNVWLCWSSIEGYEIDYIEGVKQGCLDPFILASEKYQLILNGLPNPDASVAPFNPQFPYNVVSGWSNPIGPSTGFSFSALPLARNNRIYTIHAEVNIVQKSTSKIVKRNLIFKRDSEEENTGIASFQVSEDSSSSSSSSGLSFWYFVVPGVSIGVLLLVGLVVVGVVARRRYKRVEQETASHQIPSEDNKDFVL